MRKLLLFLSLVFICLLSVTAAAEMTAVSLPGLDVDIPALPVGQTHAAVRRLLWMPGTRRR